MRRQRKAFPRTVFSHGFRRKIIEKPCGNIFLNLTVPEVGKVG